MLSKMFMEAEFTTISDTEQALKLVKSMPDGFIDQYMMWCASSRYMQHTGNIEWEPFEVALDREISDRLRAEGHAVAVRAGAQAAAPDVAMAARG